MDPIRNPYAPGAGTRLPELVGRDDIRETARIALERIRLGRPNKSIVMVELRGVGKTVLLDRISEDGYQRCSRLICINPLRFCSTFIRTGFTLGIAAGRQSLIRPVA